MTINAAAIAMRGVGRIAARASMRKAAAQTKAAATNASLNNEVA